MPCCGRRWTESRYRWFRTRSVRRPRRRWWRRSRAACCGRCWIVPMTAWRAATTWRRRAGSRVSAMPAMCWHGHRQPACHCAPGRSRWLRSPVRIFRHRRGAPSTPGWTPACCARASA
ncbi:UNVERIFIED_CONTAM: hypothetical protein NCL1_05761 [Trichonephila clavipes]